MNSKPFIILSVLALASAMLIQSKGTPMSATAKGTFDVKAAPQPPADSDDSGIARLLLDKQFYGELEAVSKGQMLAASTASKGSAGYVAIEKVTGTLSGRKGSFVLQHIGTMNKGVPTLNVSVVPDSGTGQLSGISGRMSIDIKEGKHFYAFDYSLPEAD
jgi:Protein of unknown function (DUF3224)